MKRLLLSAAAVVVFAAPRPAIAQTETPSAAPARRDTTIPLDAIIAYVGNVAITRYDLEQRLVDTVQHYIRNHLPLPGDAERKSIVMAKLTELVDEEVLLNRAKEQDLEVPEVEVSAATDQQMKQVATTYGSEDVLRRQLQQAGFSSPEEYRRFWSASYRRNRLIQLLVHKLMQEKKLPSVNIPEADILKSFNRIKDAGGAHGRPATVLWRQMVIAPTASAPAKAAAKAKIDSLRVEIVAGGDFERIAKRETMDPATKEFGGDMGWQRRGDMPEAIEVGALFGLRALRPGEVSQVIESPFGLHLVKVDRFDPPAQVKWRQILIIPKTDSVDVERARRLADSLVTAMRRGAPFDTIARHFHDQAEDPPGLMNETPRDSLPTYYQNGLKDVAKDSIVAFAIPTNMGSQKFVIAQVVASTEAGDYTYDQVKARMRSDMTQQAQMRKYIDAQRQPVYVKIWEDRALMTVTIFDRTPH